MRRAFAVLLFVVVQCLPALADFDASKAWFEGLSLEQRTLVQTDLILLGHYKYLIDGQFGNGTYEALTAFQKQRGVDDTGVLSDAELRALAEAGTQVDGELGMDLITDERAGFDIVLPTTLLTERTDAALGYTYSSADSEIAVETMLASLSGQSFRTLFELLSRPDPGQVISYEHFSDDRFVLSGTQDGYRYYTLFVNGGSEAMGFALSWGDAYVAEGEMLAVFLASHLFPSSAVDAQPPKSATASTGDQRGDFRLPEDHPELIELNAEITGTTPDDFRAALEARPGATLVVLNSPGGSVYSALLMAHEIRDRGMLTYVPPNKGCYSACAYMFFAGASRTAVGELGVHQITSAEIDLVMAQTTLGDVLDALEEFGVDQPVISRMLRTPPEDMYVFSADEIADYGINRGEPIEVALMEAPEPQPVAPGPTPAEPSTGTALAFVQLGSRASPADAEQSLSYIEGRWGTLFAGIPAEIVLGEDGAHHIQLPAPSLERASTICSAIKQAGGGCYVSQPG